MTDAGGTEDAREPSAVEAGAAGTAGTRDAIAAGARVSIAAGAWPSIAAGARASIAAGARPSIAAGARAGLPFGVAGLLLGFSFGVVARPVMGVAAPIVMSVLVFAGSAQFAALAVLASHGSAAAAIVAGVLLNLRFVPMGIAIAPSLSEGRLGRALRGQALVDASWALAVRGGGRFDVDFLLGATLVQYPGWVGGTVLGVVGGSLIGDPKSLGLDAIFPAFFLGLLMAEMRRPGARPVAAAGALIALALIPIAPAGVPVIVASLASLLGLRR